MYEAMFPYADKMYITEIEKEYDDDAVFPSFRKEEWKETESVMGREIRSIALSLMKE